MDHPNYTNYEIIIIGVDTIYIIYIIVFFNYFLSPSHFELIQMKKDNSAVKTLRIKLLDFAVCL